MTGYSYVEINSDPAEVIARAGQCSTLAEAYRGRIEPNKNELMERLFKDPGCFGLDDKFSAMIKRSMTPDIVDQIFASAAGRADELDNIAARIKEAVASIAQQDIKGAKASSEIEP